MPPTLGLVANVYNEANALPGWLETHLSFFDDVRVLHAGPQGTYSDDGTLEILEKWRVPHEFCSIDYGFGVVRTRAVRTSPCDYVMILDADERFYSASCLMVCDGEPTPQAEVDRILGGYDRRDGTAPDWDIIVKLGENLRVAIGEPYDQGGYLRRMLDAEEPDAVITVRRHWHDFSFRRPTQNWRVDPDWQARVVRNNSRVYFDPDTRMHERLVGAEKVTRADMVCGPYFDHFHFTFKRMEPAQRQHDVAIYDAIHTGKTPPTGGTA